MFVSMAVMAGQIGQSFALKQVQQEEQKGQDKNTDAGDSHIIIATDLTVHTLSEVHIDQELYQIREIVLDDVADPHVVHVAQKLTESGHFRTLFRKVISVNAP